MSNIETGMKPTRKDIALPQAEVSPHSVVFFETSGRSQRMRDALHHALDNPKGKGENAGFISEKQATTLEAINKFVEKDESRIKITDFDPPRDSEDIRERLSRSRFLPTETAGYAALVDTAKRTEDRSYWDIEGQPLLDEVDSLVYAKMQQEYGLGSPREAKALFRRSLDTANRTISSMLSAHFKDKEETWGLTNGTEMVSSPAKLVAYMTAPETAVDERVQYEFMRGLFMAELAATSEIKSANLRDSLDRLQTAVDNRIFNHGQPLGAGEECDVYTIHNDKTGKVLWNSVTNTSLTQDELNDAEISSGRVKKRQLRLRDTRDDVGYVYTHPREKTKEETLAKMVRDAQMRMDLVGDDILEPGAITDLGGMMSVLMNEDSNDGPKINALMEKHKALLKKIFPDLKGIEGKNEKRGYNGSSKRHDFRRFLVRLNDGNLIEEIFVSLPDYLRNEEEFGEFDENGIPDGPAHILYEQMRTITAARRLLPRQIYGEKNGEWVPGQDPEEEKRLPINWNERLAEAMQDAVQQLQTKNVVELQEFRAQGYVIEE